MGLLEGRGEAGEEVRLMEVADSAITPARTRPARQTSRVRVVGAPVTCGSHASFRNSHITRLWLLPCGNVGPGCTDLLTFPEGQAIPFSGKFSDFYSGRHRRRNQFLSANNS